MEQEIQEDGGAVRSQHLIHVLARDDHRAAELLAPLVDRAGTDTDAKQLQVVLLVPDQDTALTLAEMLNARPAGTKVLPVTSLERAVPRLAAGASVVACTPEQGLALMQRSALKPASVRGAAVVWGEDLLTDARRAPLEGVIAELPREAERVLLTSALREEVERFSTAFMWRARRLQHEAAEGAPRPAGGRLEYMVTAPAARATVVRQLLDAWNPATVSLVTFSEDDARDARAALRTLGYGDDDEQARVEPGGPSAARDLVIVYGIPRDAAATANAARVVALVEPRQVGALAPGGADAVPVVLPASLRDAFTARDALREELRGMVRGGALANEVLLLEPLLAEADGVQLAAAALRLLEVERSRTRRQTAVAAPRREPAAPARRAEPAADARFVRLFINIGERDGLRRGDLVGAITGEAGIEGPQVGKIELRDTHSLVEVARDVADRVVEKMNGISMRGRRIVARIDTGRPAVDRSPRDRGARERGAPRDRFSHGRGSDVGPRGERRPRERGEEGSGRTPRAAHESREWSERGERLRNSRRRKEGDAPE